MGFTPGAKTFSISKEPGGGCGYRVVTYKAGIKEGFKTYNDVSYTHALEIGEIYLKSKWEDDTEDCEFERMAIGGKNVVTLTHNGDIVDGDEFNVTTHKIFRRNA